MSFCEFRRLLHLFSRALIRSYLWCCYRYLITSMALEKCKKKKSDIIYIILVRFCPLKIKITQFPGRFLLNPLSTKGDQHEISP